MIYLVLFCLFFSILFTNPSGHHVVKGKVKVEQASNHLKVKASDRSIIHWNDFSIKKGETTQFIQPSAKSVILNRVVGKELSKIYGKLESNGKIYLINPQGILIGETGVINTNGFIASTLDLCDKEFSSGEKFFFKGENKNSIINMGTITAADGSVYLLGYAIDNRGSIVAKNGTVALSAANSLYLQPEGQEKILIEVDTKSLGTLENSGTIEAYKVELQGCTNPFTYAIKQSGQINTCSLKRENGQIYLKSHRGKMSIDGKLVNRNGKTNIEALELNIGKEAKIIDQGAGSIAIDVETKNLNHDGLIKTSGGTIDINVEDALFSNSGTLDCSADIAGTINIKAKHYLNQGITKAEGKIQGGKVAVHTKKNITEMSKALTKVNADEHAGSICLRTDIEGQILSSGSHRSLGKQGGSIRMDSSTISLPAANIQAKGTIFLGREKSEKGLIRTNVHTTLKAKKVHTFVEPEKLSLSTLLGASCDISNQVDLVDPNAGSGTNFGASVVALDNGNIVVTKPNDDMNGSDTGAFHLYNGATAAIISTTLGTTPNDRVGSDGIIQLKENNNFVVLSSYWTNGAFASAGAATWGDGSTTTPSTVTTSNSLYGVTAGSRVGSGGGIALTYGNYVVLSPLWDNGALDVGAATWGDGSTGVVGAVTTSNSLHGTSAGDEVGQSAIALTNGNYVVISSSWSGVVSNGGAATWGDGSMSTAQAVATTNSLYGTSPNDRIGLFYGGPLYESFALTNGNYVVLSPQWNGNGTYGGAATWVDGSAYYSGAVTTANSLFGTYTAGYSDYVGRGGLALSNGNYVVLSPYWNGVDTSVGAATWGDGSIGTAGAVTTTNSLYGGVYYDLIGLYGGLALEKNGNYVVLSGYWRSARGAATWVDGSAPYSGEATTANSLHGSQTGDGVGLGGIALTNGNYVVLSYDWQNGGTPDVGAATWGDGSTGIVGEVTTANSLYGTDPFDLVGRRGIALTNGNYVVLSSPWNGVAPLGGAATWGDGSMSTAGAVTTSNSLYGSTLQDRVGERGIALTNGNYVVISPFWNNGGTADAGAATCGDGTGVTVSAVSSLTVGAVSSLNSIIGNDPGAGDDMFAVDNSSALFTNSPFIVSFPNDNTSGRVVLSALGELPPTPPIPPTPIPPEIVQEIDRGLVDFYRSITESGQRWNFWNEAMVRKVYILESDKKTKTIRIINQLPFFPNYQEKGPLKAGNL